MNRREGLEGRGGRLRVLFVSPEYPPVVGGLGDYTQHLAQSLASRGLEPIVLTSKSVPAQAGPVRIIPGARWDFLLLRHAEALARALKPDLLHIQYQTAAYGMHPAVNLLPRWLARRLPDLPVVTTMHDLRQPYLFPKAVPLRRWLTRGLVLHSRAVIATNSGDAVRLQEMATNENLIPIGPNILPGAKADPWEVRRHLNLPLGAHLIGYFGFLNPTKGVDTLLRAVAKLLDRDTPVVLAILGETTGPSDPTDRRHRSDLLKLAGTMKLEPHLRWTGPVSPEQLSQTLGALDACVLPYTDGASYRRGTLIIALAHGLPIITTDSTAPPDHPDAPPSLQPEQHCLLVPPNDAEWLSTAIARLLGDKALRERLMAGAKELATHFSWETIADRHLSLYQSLRSAPP